MKRPDSALLRGRSGRNVKVFIPVVDNGSTRTGVESLITDVLREELSGMKNVQVVNDESNADYLLLGKIIKLKTEADPEQFQGSPETELQGGLKDKRITTKGLVVDLGLEIKLLQKSESNMKQVWVKNFSSNENYSVFDGTFDRSTGSSTAPYINESREKIQLKLMAQDLATQVFDQVSMDF